MIHALKAEDGVGHATLEEAVVDTVGPDIEMSGNLVPGPVFSALHVAADDFLRGGNGRLLFHTIWPRPPELKEGRQAGLRSSPAGVVRVPVL